jgi:hypothetical protein
MKTFLPLKRDKIRRAPWGYTVDPYDPYLLLPVVEHLKVLEEGKDLLDKGASLRRVADYVSTKTGVKISQTSIRSFYYNDPERAEQAKKRDDLLENFTKNNINKKYKRLPEDLKEKRNIGRLKTKVTNKQKKLQRLREEQQSIKATIDAIPRPTEETKLTIAAEAKETADEIKIVPNPGPQTEFLAAPEFDVLYGGAAGGGKSWALLVDPLRTAHLPAHKAIIFRKTNDDLRTLIGMSKELYPKLIPGAKYNEQKSTWYFPGGGWMWFRYLDKDADVESMQGQDFSWAGFDELTQWSTPFVYNYIRSRIRTTSKDIEPYIGIRCSANPGGVGGHWVKKLYIDPSPPNTPFVATDYETGQPMYWPDNHKDPKRRGTPLFYRKFIPAKLQDNPYLYNTGSYEAGLLSLPEVQRRQLLEGDWDVAEGAAFTEFNRHIHTCAPFDIPSHWMRFRGADWGYTQPGCVLWFACDPDGNLYVYREYYHRRVLAPDVADKVLEMEQGEDIRYGVMDVSAWNQRGSGDTGPSIAENMIKRGCMWRPSDRHKFSRKFGKMEIHRRLQVKLLPDAIHGRIIEKPSLIIFNTCVNLIRTLPCIPADKLNPEDVDTDSEDHAYDALRYGCMSRPIQQNQRVYRPHLTAVPQQPNYNSFGFPI